jgi:hypothetical protein
VFMSLKSHDNQHQSVFYKIEIYVYFILCQCPFNISITPFRMVLRYLLCCRWFYTYCW